MVVGGTRGLWQEGLKLWDLTCVLVLRKVIKSPFCILQRTPELLVFTPELGDLLLKRCVCCG